MILKKDQKDKNSASTSKANDSQNESFIDVFKLNAGTFIYFILFELFV